MNLDDDNSIFCGDVVQPDLDQQFGEDEDSVNQEIDQHSKHSSDGINSQGQHQEEPLIQRQQQETEVPVSPKQGHGLGKCIYCKKKFQKNASNHKVCPDPVCQEKKYSRRKISKRVQQQKRDTAKHVEEARIEQAAQQAAQAKAAQEKKPNGQKEVSTCQPLKCGFSETQNP